VPVHGGLVMVVGAFSFTGLRAAGGWHYPRGASPLPAELTAGARRSPEWHTACSVSGLPAGVCLVARGQPAVLTTVCGRAPGPVSSSRSRTASQLRRRGAPRRSRSILCPIGGPDPCAVGQTPVAARALQLPAMTS
jgi:hypothetical protein